jgi:hypothetical protein
MARLEKEMSDNDEAHIRCPFCGSSDHELFSLYGQTLIGSQYYCKSCRTVFEAVKWEDSEEEGRESEANGFENAAL